jgi:hypothetical protein
MHPKNLVDTLQVMMVREAQQVCKMIKKKVTVAEWVEVPQYGSMMRKMKTKKMKKGPCFKYGKKGDKANERDNKEERAKSGEDEHGNGQQHMQTQEHPILGSTKVLKILDKQWMLAQRSVLGYMFK